MKKLITPFAALALAGLALTGCGQQASPAQPSSDTGTTEQTGPSVEIGEAPPGKGAAFTPTDADYEVVQSAWSEIADSCDATDEEGGTIKALVCDPRGEYAVLTGSIEIEFVDRWDEDGYVNFSSTDQAVHGPNRIMDEDLDMGVTGTMHVQSGSVKFLPSHL